MVDGLMNAGVNPRDALLALKLDASSLGLLERDYNPDQPRVPAGSGRESGQWVGANTVGAAPAAPSASGNANGLPILDVAYPGDFHDFLRDAFAEALRKAGNTVLTEVPLTLLGDPPVEARIDILLRNAEGVLYGIDVKTGTASRFTPQQQIVYPHVEVGGLVASSDPKISALALTPGIPLPHIELYELYTSGPGAPLKFTPLLEYMR